MNINFLSKAIAPLAAVAALSMAAPASAAVFFGNDDTLNITGAYKTSITNPAKYEFGISGGGFASVGSYGNTGVSSSSDGAFEPFITDAVDPLYKILSVNFSDATTYLNKVFLRIDNGTDAFDFIITEAIFGESKNKGKTTDVDYTLKGIFKSLDDQTLGEGSLTSNYSNTKGIGSYSATLVVTKAAEPVPEPSALLGIGLMVGAVYVIRRRQVAIA